MPEESRTRGRRAAWWLGWAAVGALVLELVARRYISAPFPCLRPSADPALAFELRPGEYTVEGYLDRLPPVAVTVADDGCLHTGADPSALVLASSHGFGLGVPQREAFPEVLRADLAARGHALRGTRNCSVPGYQLLAQIRAAERALAARPHPLVLVFVAPHHLRVGFDWSRLAPRGAALRALVQASRVARVAYIAWLQHTIESTPEPYEPAPRLAAGLERLAAAARSRGARVALVTLGPTEHPAFNLRAEAARRGLPVIDIEPPPHDDAWTFDGEHWRARGHQRVAAALAAPVAALLASPAP